MRDDPFAKLGALDQRLFQPAASTRSVPRDPTSELPSLSTDSQPLNEPSNQGFKEPSNQRFKEPSFGGRKLERLEARNGSPDQSWDLVPEDLTRLDLATRPDRQSTYAFTAQELDGLEDLKIVLRRKYDLSITKNDLIRCAIHMLLADCQKGGEKSMTVARLRAKRSH